MIGKLSYYQWLATGNKMTHSVRLILFFLSLKIYLKAEKDIRAHCLEAEAKNKHSCKYVVN